MYNKKLLMKKFSGDLIGTITPEYSSFEGWDLMGFSAGRFGSISNNILNKIPFIDLYYYFRVGMGANAWVVNVSGIDTSSLRFNIIFPTFPHYTDSNWEGWDSTTISYTEFESKPGYGFTDNKIWRYSSDFTSGEPIPMIIQYVKE